MKIIYAVHAMALAAFLGKMVGIIGISWLWFSIPFAFYLFIAASLYVANRKINNGGSFFKSRG
jgi:4-hydroxybenzoate polyprenyltransferase